MASTISLCMIVCNEEAVLERCLASAEGIADEICVVDTGSTDGTLEILKSSGAVYQKQVWQEDFSAARNAAFDMASCDYQLWLDADDIIEEEQRQAFLQLKQELSTEDVIMLPYRLYQNPTDAEPVMVFYRERLLKRSAGFRWTGAVHECIQLQGNVRYGTAAVSHKPLEHDAQKKIGRNLRIYQRRIAAGQEFSLRDWYYYGRELADNGAYNAAASTLERFLSVGGAASPVDRIGAYTKLSECYYAMGQRSEALHAVLQTLGYGQPSAEICCRIGGHYLSEQRYQDAAFWYHAALHCPPPDPLAFTRTDAQAFLPYLQLCVCYDRMGQKEQAVHYHQLAYAIHPDNPFCQANQAYLEKDNQSSDIVE